MKLFCAWSILTLVSVCQACEWDRDTLAHEASQQPEAGMSAVGAFDRNPPEYYKMRLERVQRELKVHPQNFDLYDDAAVAADRLGKCDLAISIIKQKMARTIKSTDPMVSYRSYSNLGTIEIHKWLVGGAKVEDIQLAKDSKTHIEKALKINSNAHFGREKVQLVFTDWLIRAVQAKSRADVKDLSEEFIGNSKGSTAEIKGLAGLVVMGYGWEVPDIHLAIAQLLGHENKGVMGYVSVLRCEELTDKGLKSFADSSSAKWLVRMGVPRDRIPRLESTFRSLRKQCDEWNEHRNTYMLAKMKLGKHPDTDPNFWSGFKEKLPTITEGDLGFWATRGPADGITILAECIAAGFILLCGSLLIFVLVRRSKRKVASGLR